MTEIATKLEKATEPLWEPEHERSENDEGTPTISRFFFAAFRANAIAGAAAVDGSRAGELVPVLRQSLFDEPGTFGFFRQTSLFGRGVGGARSVDLDISGGSLDDIVAVEKALADPGIVRHRGKIEAIIGNAQAFLEIQKEFGSFDAYLWGWVDGKPVVTRWKSLADMPAVTPLAEAIAKDMKKRGFKFFGPTICYAYLQAVGVVDDHMEGCFKVRD